MQINQHHFYGLFDKICRTPQREHIPSIQLWHNGSDPSATRPHFVQTADFVQVSAVYVWMIQDVLVLEVLFVAAMTWASTRYPTINTIIIAATTDMIRCIHARFLITSRRVRKPMFKMQARVRNVSLLLLSFSLKFGPKA